MRASHEFLDHTSEMRLRVRGPSLEEVFAETARAVGVLLRGAVAVELASARDFTLDAHDTGALLVDWINELLYVAEVDRWVPVAVERVRVTEVRLEARIAGGTVPASPALIKAATHHELAVRSVAAGIEAEVILDV